jgi:hypothetical protein
MLAPRLSSRLVVGLSPLFAITCCPCGSTKKVDRDEDGSPSFRPLFCSHPGCDVELCASCARRCSTCDEVLCEEHRSSRCIDSDAHHLVYLD